MSGSGDVRPHRFIANAEWSMLIPEELRQCVAFAYYRDRAAGGFREPAGTVFFVVDLDPDLGPASGPVYAITARHVIDKIATDSTDDRVWLRLNTSDGESDWFDLPLSMWKWHPNDDAVIRMAYSDTPYYDVAACLFVPDPDRVQFKPVTTQAFVDAEKIGRYAIGPGDDIFLTGLFANHLGHHRNLPIVRCGNLAAMPEEPVATEVGPMEAFLIEARSIGGLSGSPCFVSLGQYRLIGRDLQPPSQFAIFLLGMVHGHWDARSGDIVPAAVDEQEAINKGIAIVLPASHILETIRQEAFAAEVAAEKQRYLELHGPAGNSL
jgi:hypothetical protein